MHVAGGRVLRLADRPLNMLAAGASCRRNMLGKGKNKGVYRKEGRGTGGGTEKEG